MRDPDRRMPITDVELEAALRDLAGSLALPGPDGAAVLDPARRARLRIEQGDVGARPWGRWAWLAPSRGRRFGRGLALALVAVVVVAAVAGALGLGLPGIRIVPAPSGSAAVGSPTPPRGASGSPLETSASPTVGGSPGAGLDLGHPIALADAASSVDIPLRLPTAPGVGSPASAWLFLGRLSFVWPASGTLPSTREPGVGLILSEFRGSIQPDYFEKVIGPDTKINAVSVDGVTGYWISGAPHEIVFIDANGEPVFDSRRIVGDTLLWARGDVTYRLESGLDQAAAIALADSLR
jgi:hypothetical protein